MLLSKLTLPTRVGLMFGFLGLLFTIIGIVRGNIPNHLLSIALALLIGGGVWFAVSWAVTMTVVDVESDTSESVVMESDAHDQQ